MQTFLSPEELRALDATCVEFIAEQPPRMAGFAALRVLIATGCRMSEILSAQRRYFDPANATLWLPRDKASDDGREVLLSPAAVQALQSWPVTSSPYLFASHARCGHMVTLLVHADDAFARVGLKRVRVHDLRHSFASAAVGDGVSSCSAIGTSTRRGATAIWRAIELPCLVTGHLNGGPPKASMVRIGRLVHTL